MKNWKTSILILWIGFEIFLECFYIYCGYTNLNIITILYTYTCLLHNQCYNSWILVVHVINIIDLIKFCYHEFPCTAQFYFVQLKRLQYLFCFYDWKLLNEKRFYVFTCTIFLFIFPINFPLLTPFSVSGVPRSFTF